MSEAYTPTGATAAAVTRFTAAEAATGTFGTMHRTWQTEIADRTRFLATTGLVAFPATQVTSADANTLDDYEEGTFTATLVCGTSGTITLNSGAGGDLCNYTKKGREVTINGNLIVSSVSSPVGALMLSGIPFTIKTGNSNYSAIVLYSAGLAAGAATAMHGYVIPNTSTGQIDQFAAGATGNAASRVQAASQFVFSCTFNV